MKKIEYSIMIGDDTVCMMHFQERKDAEDYMAVPISKDPKLSNVPIRIVSREVGE